jgi:hypothetical protein
LSLRPHCVHYIVSEASWFPAARRVG